MNFKKKNAANAPAPNQAQQAARRRSLRSGAYASVLAVVVLVLVILLNLVVGAVPTKFTQFDISTGKMFTLSDTTKTMLQELNTDVTAYYLAETGNEDSNITRILDRYAGESSHFTWQQRDPALYPTFAQQYDAQNASSSSVILVCGDNHTVVDYNDMYTADYSSYYTTGSYTMSFSAENALSSGIAKVTRENSYVLYQLTGHGESSLESDFTETLDNSGVTVQDLNLLTTDTVPEDAAALLINDPQADLSTLDAAAIKTSVLRSNLPDLRDDESASGGISAAGSFPSISAYYNGTDAHRRTVCGSSCRCSFAVHNNGVPAAACARRNDNNLFRTSHNGHNL